MADLSQPTPTQTPNVVVHNPDVRRIANLALGILGLLVATAITVDYATPAFDIAAITTPVFVGYAYLASIFGLVVTTPNVPK